MPRIPLRRRLLACAMVPLLTLAVANGDAQAEIGFPDTVPAATLLLPYFAVDLANPNGQQTRFSVINTKAAPQLAKVTLWTNLGVPTFSFDIYLDGRDRVDVDLRQVFAGMLPETGPGLATPGAESDPAMNFAGCTDGLNEALGISLPVPARLSEAQIAHLGAAHTGRKSASFGNLCAASDLGDRVARGYATVDVVQRCEVGNPTTAGYFVTGGIGLASNENVLAGTFTLTERSPSPRASGGPLVHIEASASHPLTSLETTPAPDTGDYTFYSSYTNGVPHDHREPLGGVWQVPIPGDAASNLTTEALVWRDPGGRPPTPFAAAASCTTPIQVFPLDQHALAFFDDTEEIFFYNTQPPPPNPPIPDVAAFPLATQIADLSALTPFTQGWAIFNLNGFASAFTPGSLNGMGVPGLRQSVVMVRNAHPSQTTPFRLATQSVNVGYQTGGPTSCTNPAGAGSGESPCLSFYSGAQFP